MNNNFISLLQFLDLTVSLFLAILIMFISNEDMDNIIRIVKSLENSDLLIDGANETLKRELKNKKVGFFLLWCHLCLLH